MKSKFIFLSLLLSFTFSMTAMANNNPQIQDFAYALPISNVAVNKLNTFIIPKTVYQDIVYANLSDIRLFNADKKLVPILLRNHSQKDITQQIPLNFFPVTLKRSNRPGNLTLQISKQSNGKITRVRIQDTDKPSNNSAYIIDVSQLDKKAINQLRFQWKTVMNYTWVSNVTIKGSDDLRTWHKLQSGVLAQLSKNQNLIRHNTVKIPSSHYNYLFVQINQSSSRFQLTRVSAQIATPQEKTMQWATLTPTKIDSNKATYYFASQANYPSQEIRFVVPRNNFSSDVSIFSRNNNERSWSHIKDTLIYKLNTDRQQFEKTSTSVYGNHDHFWKVKMHPFAGNDVKMQLGWPAAQIFFIADDKGPYELAFGSAQTDRHDLAASSSIQQLLNNDNKVNAHEISIGDSVITLAGKNALEKQFALPYQKILLWLVLIAAVLFLGLMARHLYRNK